MKFGGWKHERKEEFFQRTRAHLLVFLSSHTYKGGRFKREAANQSTVQFSGKISENSSQNPTDMAADIHIATKWCEKSQGTRSQIS